MTPSTVRRLDDPELERRLAADFAVEDGWTYLQSAGTGLPVPGAAVAAGTYYREVARRGCDAWPSWRGVETSVRDRLGRLLGVAREEIGFFRSTSEIVNLVAASVPWRGGEEILGFADEYPCNVLPWQRQAAAGARLVQLDVADPAEREDRLVEAITERTSIVSISHVHPWTGVRLDLQRIGRACREVDALLVVDGIQALGAVPVDLTDVDVYGAGVFKWLLSGFGTAVGVVGERARSRLNPVFRSYRNPPPSDRLDYTAANLPGLYVLDASLAYLEELGWDVVHGRVELLTAAAFEDLADLGISPLTPLDRRAGIVSLEVPNSAAVAAAMQARQISVSDKEGRTLISPHCYNTRDEIRRFAVQFAEVLDELGR
ncbi:MAG TPA: aminotransferase class V-fold PLP-dependent enzyme [Microbacteriaceae bacterium]|nr:aminotransferase class V-fold PLP-dependent enzyme [Microbacteriaceae bacterium]